MSEARSYQPGARGVLPADLEAAYFDRPGDDREVIDEAELVALDADELLQAEADEFFISHSHFKPSNPAARDAGHIAGLKTLDVEKQYKLSVNTFVDDIGNRPILTRGQERLLAQRKDNGDESAREELVKRNIRLVMSIAKKYVGQGVPYLDLVQEGSIGLMKAIEKYDWRLGYKLSTYATWWIRQAVIRSMISQSQTIQFPNDVMERGYAIRRAHQRLVQELGCEPTPEDIAEHTNLKTRQVVEFLEASKRLHNLPSLDSLVGDGSDTTLAEMVEDRHAADTAETAEANIISRPLAEALRGLKPREQVILTYRFGLNGETPHTLEEIGKKIGRTRERVRQLEAAALTKLSELPEIEGFRQEGGMV